jgi:hypothetical protein
LVKFVFYKVDKPRFIGIFLIHCYTLKQFKKNSNSQDS